MEIQDIGAIGELTAALATIATLLYLARQIQLGSKTIQASNFSTMVDAMSAMHNTGVELADFIGVAQSGSRELNESEAWLMHTHCVQMFLGFETAFLFHLHGTVDQQYFDARARTIDRMGALPYFRRWFAEYGKDIFDERFVRFVEERWTRQSRVETSFVLPETSAASEPSAR